MKIRVFLFCWIFLVLSCNQVNDLNPVDPDAEPVAAVEVVKEKFPDAKGLVFKTILSSRIWEVDFASGADQYTSLVDKTKMWETYKARPDSVPPFLIGLMPRTSFAAGTFSMNTEDIELYPSVNRRNRLIYSLSGYDYFFEWFSYANPPYTPTNATLEQYRYKVASRTLKDFPKMVADFMSPRKDLTFFYGEVRVRANYERQYYLQVLFTRNGKDMIGFLLLDKDGKLVWMSRDFNEPAVYKPGSNIDTLPEPIQKHLDDSPELSKFSNKPEDIFVWKGEYDGVTCYYLKLSHYVQNTFEQCELYFDGDGNLINRRIFLSF